MTNQPPSPPPVRLILGDVSAFDPAAGHTPAAMSVADPPYNFGVKYGASAAAADRLTPEAYLKWCYRWFWALARTTAPGGCVWLVIPDEWAAEFAVYGKRALGLTLQNWVKWHETFGVQTTGKFARTSRHLLHFLTPGGPGFFDAAAVKVPSARQTKYNDRRAAAGGKVPGNVWEFSRVCGTFRERVPGLPTQLPEAMLERVVRATCPPGGLVREFFAGSGSLARVCVREGRAYEGWERDPQTHAVAAARLTA